MITNDIVPVCHELLSCICFNDITILCKVDKYSDIDEILVTLNELKKEYDIKDIVRLDMHTCVADNSFIKFYNLYAFELKIKEMDKYTIINFLQ